MVILHVDQVKLCAYPQSNTWFHFGLNSFFPLLLATSQRDQANKNNASAKVKCWLKLKVVEQKNHNNNINCKTQKSKKKRKTGKKMNQNQKQHTYQNHSTSHRFLYVFCASIWGKWQTSPRLAVNLSTSKMKLKHDSMLNGCENSFMSIYLWLFLCNPLCGWCILWWHTNQSNQAARWHTHTHTHTQWYPHWKENTPCYTQTYVYII